MKIEVGKVYVTNDDVKVKIICDRLSDPFYATANKLGYARFIGILAAGSVHNYDENGKIQGIWGPMLDIKSEYRQPHFHQGTYYVNFDPKHSIPAPSDRMAPLIGVSTDLGVWDSKEQALASRKGNVYCIKTLELTITAKEIEE